MDPLLEIVVDDMKNEGFGPTKFTTYRISSKIRGSSSEKPAFCRKRYSDFEKLRDEMLDACPGCVIPPLPVKQTLGKYAEDFVEKRREMLELFLQQVCSHPLASVCETLHAFLTWPEPIRSAVVERARRFEQPLTPAAYATGDPLTEGNKHLADFEKQISSVRERFKHIQGRQDTDATDFFQLSQGIKELGDNPLNMVLNCALPPYTEGLQNLATHYKKQSLSVKQGLLPKLKLYRQVRMLIAASEMASKCLRLPLMASGAGASLIASDCL